MRRILYFLMAVFLFSCEKDKIGTGVYYYAENYINRYYDGGVALKMLEGHHYGNREPMILQTGFVIAPSGGLEYGPWYFDSYAKEQFLKIAERNGDTSFNRKVFNGERLGEAFADNFHELHIVSDADWDEEHPAGTLLDDILSVRMYSFAEFIRNGYHDLARNKSEPLGDYRSLQIIQKRVSELTSDDMEIIAYSISDMTLQTKSPVIVFTSAPTLEKEHTLTLRWTTVEGDVKTASVTCTPEVDPVLQ